MSQLPNSKPAPKFPVREEFSRLAPCPRCRSTENLTSTWDTKDGYYVECTACKDAVGPKSESYRAAFEHWNRWAARAGTSIEWPRSE